MREESHLDEMRTAIRGDFERLAERRGEQELMRVAEHEPPPQAVEPALELTAAAALDPEPLLANEQAAAPEDEPGAEVAPRRSWLARFLSP
jgi:hypothetical protein